MVNVNLGDTEFSISFDSSTWPSGNVVFVSCKISYDNTTTWEEIASATLTGDNPSTGFSFSIDQPDNPNRYIDTTTNYLVKL